MVDYKNICFVAFIFEVVLLVLLPIILYFYEPNHDVCLRQGEILDNLNRKQNNVLNILAFDMHLSDAEPLIMLMKEHYGISVAPTLVINENIKIEGLAFEVEIKEALGL